MNFKQILSVIISILLIFNNALIAQSIVVDSTASSKYQATMDKAQNGIDIVNIVNPDSKGTSHNKFSSYSVEKQGVILNNSLKVVQTQLGGYIANNSNLTNNAKLILNEVTGTSRTLLEGYTEVGGVKADVIIANPNGITINGGGFINTDKAILTTGRPNIINGYLNGFNINQGDILIEGEGFNTQNINQVGLYSNLLQINAQFYANEANIITGNSQIDLEDNITNSNKIGSGISIDSSLLGGIYANKITLVSNDKGVGVNLPPEVFAQESFVLNANGDILAQNIEANSQLEMNTTLGDMTFKNKVYSKNIVLNAEDTITLEEDDNIAIIAEDSLTMSAKNLDNNAYIYSGYSKDLSTVNSDSTSSIDIENINNKGLVAANNLNINSKNISNHGAFYSHQNMNIEADILNNFEMIRSNEDIELFVKDTLNNDGVIYSDNNLTISDSTLHTKSNIINNNNVIQSDKDINIYAKTLNNIAVTPTVKSTSSTSTRKTGGGNNYDLITTTIKEDIIDVNTLDPSKILAEGNISIDVETLNNFYSLIASNDNITLTANTANNIGKIVVKTTTVSTKKYRDEKYCSIGGPSGSCIRHKHRAAYRGTFTSTTTEKVPVINFGIQAKNSITGNVVTLNNLSDQVAGNLADKDIQDKLNIINEKEIQSSSVQELTQGMVDNNLQIVTLLENEEELSTLLENIETEEDLLVFKDDLLTLEENLLNIITNDKENLVLLNTTLQNIKNSFSSSEQEQLVDLEGKVNVLKNNIETNETLLDQFNTVTNSIGVLDDIIDNKEELIALDQDIKDIIAQNSTTLDYITNNNLVTILVDTLEEQGNTLRDEINVALELKDHIEYKKISSQDGLYQTNLTTSTQDISTNIASKPSKVNNEIFVPESKFGLFITTSNPSHKYLIESNPLYTNYGTFISSDYMIGKLDLDTEEISKRLGDAMYETTFVRDMVIKSTGKRFLSGFDSDMTQFKALMDNAIAIKDDLQLSFGVTLSKQQIAALNKNIIWMEEKVVKGEKVLVPQLYLASNNITTDGSIINASNINLNIEQELLNNGAIQSLNDLNIEATTIINQNGKLDSGKNLNLSAKESINNLSGVIQADGDISLLANKNIRSETLSKQIIRQNQGGKETNTLRGDTAKISAGGKIDLIAKNDIILIKSDINAQSNLNLDAKDISINSLAMKSDYDYRFGNGYNKGKNTTNLKSNLNGENITVNADTLSITSSDINGANEVSLAGVKDVKILSNNDVSLQDMQITTSSGFMGKKTQRDMYYKEKVVSSNITGKNILINSDNDVTLEAAKLKADENIVIDAKNDINIMAKQYREGELHFTKKSSWGGLSKSASMDRTDALKSKEAKLQTEALNIILKSGNDIKILGSNIEAASDLQMEATNEILVSAVQELIKKEKWTKKSSFNLASFVASLGTLGLIDFGPIYEMEYKLDGNIDGTAKGSSLVSGNNININAGNAKIVGSNLEAKENINAITDVGSIEILSAKEEKQSYSEDKKIEVKMASIVDITNSLHGLSGDNDTKLKITLAQATYDNIQNNEQQTTNKSSNVVSNEGNIGLDSTENINIEGSNIQANNGNIVLNAEQNVNIQEAVNTSSSSSKETHAKAEISATVQNEYVEAVKAYQAVEKAAKQLKQSKKDYKEYKDSISQLESNLAVLKQELANKTPGVDKDDIDEFSELISDIKSDEKYYLAAIAAATVNLASKTTIAVQQTAAAAASSATYGFSAGVSFDVEGSKTKTNSNSTMAFSSNMSANNITITTRNDLNNQTNISGSNIIAKEDLTIDTNELNITASQDTSNTTSKTKDISGSVSMTMYGAASGPQVSLGYGQSNAQNSSVKNNNTQINAKNITTRTKEDTNIKGANVNASELLTMIVGGDLNIESQKDTFDASQKGFNISAGFGLGTNQTNNTSVGTRTSNGKLSSANAGYGASNGRTKVKQTVLTSVTGKEVNIQVDKNTNLKGSLLAAGQYDTNSEFKDNGNLNLTTDTLTYQNSTNRVYDNSKSFNVGVGLGFVEKKNDDGTTSQTTSLTTANLSYSNSNTYEKSKTLATLGKGNVTINDTDNSDDTTALNRDTAKVQKDIYSAKTNLDVDMTLDGRLLTEDGRKQIAKDYEKSKKIIDTVDKIVSTEDITVGDFFKELDKSSKMQDVIQNIIENNPEIAKTISENPDSSISQNKTAMQIIAMAVLNEYGYSLDNVKFLNTNEKGQGNNDIKGFVTTQNDNIYLNLKNINSMTDMLSTLGQELAGFTQKKEGVDITTNHDQHNNYQDMIAKDLINDVVFALSNSNDTTVSDKPIIIQANSIEEYLALQNNNAEFSGLDKELGDNLTVFVHGTFSSPKDADKDFIDAISKTYNESVYQFDWSGKGGTANGDSAENNTQSRANAAWRLTQYIENYNFKEGEPLNIVMHSHGSNVGKDFTQFYEGDKKIDSFVMLAGPVRDDYVIDYSKFVKNAKIINVYDTSDLVQRIGGSDFPLLDFSTQYNLVNIQFGKIGLAEQEIKNQNVKNIKVEVPNKNFYDEPFGDHSNMDSKPVWNEIKNEVK